MDKMDKTIIPATTDLEQGIRKTYIDTVLGAQDNEAHQIDVHLYRGKDEVALDGASVSGYFIRYADNATISLFGTVSGNIASVTLKKPCYSKAGQFAVIIKVSSGDMISTVYYGEGTIYHTSTDTIVDEENVIPSLDDLLAQIAVMERGTANANAAADRANAAALNAENQTDAAKTATDNANAAALKIDGMTVSATKAENASATITDADGVKHIAFTLPKGDKGDKGDPGTIENVTITSIAGLPEALDSKQPVGNYAKTINSIAPDASGNILLDADDVGALAAGGTAVNADKLGNLTFAEVMLSVYPIGSIYMTMSEISPAVLFGGTWTMRSNSFLVGAGDLYAVGSTGGEAEHVLTVDEIPEHEHDIMIESKKVQSGSTYARVSTDGSYTSGIIGTAGGGLAHNNLPPYLAVYIWERVG